jgi:hypothetical protein
MSATSGSAIENVKSVVGRLGEQIRLLREDIGSFKLKELI